MISEKTGPWVFAGMSANSIYHTMIDTIKLEGERAAPRGLPTTELLHCITRIESPRCRVLSVPGRKLNPFFNLAEPLWILNGKSEAWWILYFNSQLSKYLDSPMTDFYGAYGERIRRWPQVKAIRLNMGQDIVPEDQLLDCYWTLHNAPESRQAAIILRNPRADRHSAMTADRPCNIAVTFKVRRGRLWMSVFNRSNDVVLGLTSTNIVQFSTIQETLASWLGVQVGPYTHYSDSLHLYESQDISGHVGHFNVYDYVDPTPMTPMAPGESDQMRDLIYKHIGNLINIHLRNLLDDGARTEYLAKAISQTKFDSACPYWISVAYGLEAYIAHKSVKDWFLALNRIALMETPDWQIECLRHLADRYYGVKALNEEFVDGVNSIFHTLPIHGGLEAAQAVWAYIFQSAVAVPPMEL